MKNVKVSKPKAVKPATSKSERDTTPVKTAVVAPKSTRMADSQPAQAITPEEIARRAYAIWEGQGRPAGKEKEHWLQAEVQLKASQSFSE